MFNSAAPSIADIAAVTDGNRNSGWANGDGWWALIILFALFGGWGRGGMETNPMGGSFPDIGRPSVITLRLIQNRNERR